MIQQDNKSVVCAHFPNVTIKRSIPNQSNEVSNIQASLKKKNLKCSQCLKFIQTPWICIYCQAVFCQDNKMLHMNEHAKFKGQNDHCIFINAFYTEVYCVTCQSEVLDFEQYGKTGNEDIFKHWVNPQRVRLEYHHLFYKTKQMDIFGQKSPNEVDHCGILNIGNSSFLNCVLQVILNLKIVQQVFKKLNTAYEQQTSEARSNKKRFLRYLCTMSECMRQKNPKIINSIELIRTLSQLNKAFTGYCRKDAFVINYLKKKDFFKFIVNFIHEEFKYSNSIQYDREIKFISKQPIEHEWQIIFKDFSLIQCAFKGKLSSYTVCPKCKNTNYTVEDFLGLSLEIPTQSPSKQQGVMGIFANKLGLSKNSKITLKDCFDNFITTEQIIPNQFCQACNTQTYFERKYSFKQLPNYFCIHFQRLLANREKDSTLIEFPIQSVDFGQILRLRDEKNSPVSQLFTLSSVIVHQNQQGGDQYETILFKNNTYIAIKDEHKKVVDLQYIEQSEAYILFYEQVPSVVNDSIKKNLKANTKLIQSGEVKFAPDQLCYLPSYWYQQFMHLAKPNMVITSHFLCVHGQLRPDYWDCFDAKFEDDKNDQSAILNQSIVSELNSSCYPNQDPQTTQPYHLTSSSLQTLELCSNVIPTPVCEFLIDQFGGGPIIPCNTKPCQDCIEQAQWMRHRRRLERALIQKYDSKDEPTNHIVVEQWMRKWQQYLYAAKMQIKRNYVLGLPPPLKIQNTDLLDNDRKLLPNIVNGVHYRLVSNKIWKILQIIYEGGPTIILKDGENNVQDNKKFNLDSEDEQTIKEIKSLYDQCKPQDNKIIFK